MICVDASVAAKWIFEEEYSRQAVALVEDCRQSGQRIVAPPLLPVEVSNVIRRRMLRDGLALTDAEGALDRFMAFPIAVGPRTQHEQDALYLRALRLAAECDLPAVYDAQYMALAETLGCALWTDDRRLLRLVGDKLNYVKWIADYPVV
ncbi:MAG TPA: type II toxin-antitoxin system VapC family toxin [Tepidiformaceae bacterium]